MLLQIHDYIKRQGMVSTRELARRFQLDEQALEPMLLMWLKKGKIRVCQTASCQSTCARCKIKSAAYYEAVK